MVADHLMSRDVLFDNPLAYPVIVQDTVKQRWIRTDTGKSLVASGVLMGLGLFTYKDSGFLNRQDVKNTINRYLPGFRDKIDDVTQWVPWAAALALPAVGVESKHKFWRKASGMAISGATQLIVVQSMKYGIGELRPDGSSRNSFPSGHTATAFMGAHIFHKEYGERSIYYSIGGYLLATITGIFRQLNDRHWISDVFFGAGLGISLTEFGYWVNGKIFKDRQINEIEVVKKPINRDRPSFIGVKAGWAGLTDEFNDPESGVSAKDGFYLGIEGAWFFSKHVGIGAEFGFQSFPIGMAQEQREEAAAEGYGVELQPIGSTKNVFGPYFSWGKGKSLFGLKAHAGWAQTAETQVFLVDLDNPDQPNDEKLVAYYLEPETRFAWSLGFTYKWSISERLTVGVYVDYSDLDFQSTETYIDDFQPDGTPNFVTQGVNIPFESVSAGATFGVMIW